MVHKSRKAFALANSQKAKEHARKMRGYQSAKYDQASSLDESKVIKQKDDSNYLYSDIQELEDLASSFSSPPMQPIPHQKEPEAADIAAQKVVEEFTDELSNYIRTSPDINNEEVNNNIFFDFCNLE